MKILNNKNKKKPTLQKSLWRKRKKTGKIKSDKVKWSSEGRETMTTCRCQWEVLKCHFHFHYAKVGDIRDRCKWECSTRKAALYYEIPIGLNQMKLYMIIFSHLVICCAVYRGKVKKGTMTSFLLFLVLSFHLHESYGQRSTMPQSSFFFFFFALLFPSLRKSVSAINMQNEKR